MMLKIKRYYDSLDVVELPTIKQVLAILEIDNAEGEISETPRGGKKGVFTFQFCGYRICLTEYFNLDRSNPGVSVSTSFYTDIEAELGPAPTDAFGVSDWICRAVMRQIEISSTIRTKQAALLFNLVRERTYKELNLLDGVIRFRGTISFYMGQWRGYQGTGERILKQWRDEYERNGWSNAPTDETPVLFLG